MLDPNYVVGLVDGEGSFTVHIPNPRSKKKSQRRAKIEPRFYLKLVAKDKEILYELKSFFGCGNVYSQKDTRKNHQDCYRYEVANRKDLREKIIPFFKEERLRLKSKKKDFDLFCKIMKGIQEENHLSEEGLKELYSIKKEMH